MCTLQFPASCDLQSAAVAPSLSFYARPDVSCAILRSRYNTYPRGMFEVVGKQGETIAVGCLRLLYLSLREIRDETRRVM